jgi:enoyl-CoA hydratase/carnithine racemase
MDASFERIELTTTHAVGSLRLARPDRGNALDHRTLEELIAAAAWFDARSDVRVVIVASSGRSFCSGFDLEGPGPVSGDGGFAASVDLGRLAMNAITSMRAITVARVHGRASGGGVVLALACDLCVAAKDAEFSLPESHLGIPIPWATLPRLVRQIGPARTKELVLSSRPFSGADAAAYGLVTSAVPVSELDAAVDALVVGLARTPRLVAASVLAEIDRLAECIAATDDGTTDIANMTRAFADDECRAALRESFTRRRPVETDE